jgi:hypothetical protein
MRPPLTHVRFARGRIVSRTAILHRLGPLATCEPINHANRSVRDCVIGFQFRIGIEDCSSTLVAALLPYIPTFD